MATYLVTGASRGIGLELTKQLLELPASQVSKVFALTRSSPSGPLQALIQKSPNRAVSILASVDDTESVRKAAREIETQLGTSGLDVLINNAGITSFSPGGSRTIPPEQLADVFNVHVTGAQRMISAFMPLLEKGEQKKVVNMYALLCYQFSLRGVGFGAVLTLDDSSSSMGSISLCKSYRCAPSQAYKVSKAALHMLNAQYAMEHADAGFTFLCVSPGVCVF